MKTEDRIRAYMKDVGRDLSCPAIADALGIAHATCYAALKRMPDTWIDRWTFTGGRGRPHAIWSIVPDDCPPPTKKVKPVW